MIKITGTINVRLLLSATPPFCRNATISFPTLPHFDISAKPLIKSAFNAMGLPGMRSYGMHIALVREHPADKQYNPRSPMSHRASSVQPHTAWMSIASCWVESPVSGLLPLGCCRSRFMVLKTSPRLIPWVPATPMSVSRLPSSTSHVCTLFANKAEADLLVFSTRTILKNRDPWWEEEAFSTSN